MLKSPCRSPSRCSLSDITCMMHASQDDLSQWPSAFTYKLSKNMRCASESAADIIGIQLGFSHTVKTLKGSQDFHCTQRHIILKTLHHYDSLWDAGSSSISPVLTVCTDKVTPCKPTWFAWILKDIACLLPRRSTWLSLISGDAACFLPFRPTVPPWTLKDSACFLQRSVARSRFVDRRLQGKLCLCRHVIERTPTDSGSEQSTVSAHCRL